MSNVYRGAGLDTAALATWRKAAIAGGITSVALGLVLLIWPDQTLLVVAALFGVWLVLVGIARLASAITDRGTTMTARALDGVLGLALIVLGIILLADLVGTLRVIALLIGLSWIIGGLVEIAATFSRGVTGGQRIGTVIFGLISVIGGIVVLAWPEISLTVLIWFTGLWLILLGLVQLALAWRAARLA